jgi:hypothetical protein
MASPQEKQVVKKEFARIIGRPVANEAPNAGDAEYFSARRFRSVFDWFSTAYIRSG